MRRITALPCLLALCSTASLLSPCSALAGQAEAKAAPTSGTVEYSSGVSEVDSCNQAQYRMPANATATAMRLSTAIQGEYATFTCRANWSLSPAALPTYRPILFSPSA